MGRFVLILWPALPRFTPTASDLASGMSVTQQSVRVGHIATLGAEKFVSTAVLILMEFPTLHPLVTNPSANKIPY